MLPYLKKDSTCCCAVDCNMRRNTNLLSKIKMYKFPMDPIRLTQWKIAVRRANWEPKNCTRICSLHFVTGKPSRDPHHPDYVPSIFSYNMQPVNVKEVERCKKNQKCSKEIEENSLNDVITDKCIENEMENEELKTLYLEYLALEIEKRDLENKLKKISKTSLT